jgi:uncharacterized protein YhbP (UPF0306 family)
VICTGSETHTENAMSKLTLGIVRITDPAGAPIATSEISLRRVHRSVHRLLAENVLCSIASITADGHAHINTAYFSYAPELEIYFLSHQRALHCQNISSNPSMAMAVFSSNQTWGGSDCGLQLFGICKQATGRQATKADRLYSKRFAEYHAWRAGLAPTSPGRDYRFYRFIANELKVFDEKELGAGIFVLVKVQRHTRLR